MTIQTVTNEAIAGVADLKAGYTLGNADVLILKAISRDLLAVREAQSVPFAYMHRSGQVVTREECGNDEVFAICCKVETPLYTAPPAPAVPAELLDAMVEVIRISDRDHEAWDRAKGAISACRAAKPVAPIEMTGALAMTKYGIKRSNYTQWVKGWNACRAAMLAAAPTQEGDA